MTAVVDAGVLYALVDAADTSHADCVSAIEAESEAIVVPLAVLPEVCYLIGSRLGSDREAAFIRHLINSDWRLEPLAESDLERVAALMAQHPNSGVGFVHAAVAAIAERMGASRLYTLSRRHYELLRPSLNGRVQLLPDRSSPD